MIVIKKFVLKDVRCFEGVQEFNIRPLTFLVGENSTGKSTILGCMQALGNFAGIKAKKYFYFDFNSDPYQMGAYIDIARKVGGRGGRSTCFDLGFEMQFGGKETVHLLVTLNERESGSEPAIQQLKMEFDGVVMVFKVIKQNRVQESAFLGVNNPSKSTPKNEKPVYTFEVSDEENLFMTIRLLGFQRSNEKINKQFKELINLLEKISSHLDKQTILFDLMWSFRSVFPPYEDIDFESFAPIRSKPMRTYDPVREVEDPEGSGMPMTLMNMYRNDKKGWKDMQKRLMEFGEASGLFTNIEIKKHGQSVNDPFQLQVKAIGPKTNIIDVGYGVSQILPILVRIVKARQGTLFLVQQPEVHLHPKGQAELTSLLVDLNKNKKSFVVETHSDAMIDRARIEIMKKRIKPEDVSLIYLEPSGNKVEVHNISFDEQANMIDVPGSYRDFFLKESDKLLGFGD